MKFPEKCPHCNVDMKLTEAYWLQRTDLDFDSDNSDRIEDQIYECSICHTLFRAKWKLIDFKELTEK